MTIPIGTRVVMNYNPNMLGMGNTKWLDGKEGVVDHYMHGECAIVFDHYDPRLHNLNGRAEDGYGYYIEFKFLTPIYDNQSLEDLL